MARLDFPLLRTKEDFERPASDPDIVAAQKDIEWATHIVLVYPLWLGTMPAVLKAFLEQVFREGFAFETGGKKLWAGRLTGRSARIVVTMGMPAWFYRWYFRAHSLKSLERNILRFSGIGPIHESLFGMVEAVKDAQRRKWLEELNRIGRRAR